MSEYNSSQYNSESPCNQGCEFVIPIKLAVPVEINPILSIKAVSPVREHLNVHLEPNIHLSPEVGVTPPTCLPKNNGFSQSELNALQRPKILQSS